MVETSARRYTDAELSEATLVVTDEAELANALSIPPPPHCPPEIIVEYDLPEQADPRRCCFCQSHTPHRKGFVVRFDSTDRYLVGSHCGPKYLGLQFRSATGAHSKLKDRQGVLHKLAGIAELAPRIRDWCDDVLFVSLKEIDAAARALQKAAPDAVIRLRALMNSGGQLSEDIRVRDYAAEASRQDGLDGEEPSPIFTVQRSAIGPLRGSALLDVEAIQDAVYALKAHAAQVSSVVSKGTDGYLTTRLNGLAVEFDRKRDAASEGVSRAQRAHLFFAPDHLAHLARWARQGTNDKLEARGGALVIEGRAGSVTIAAPPPIAVPPMPKAEG